MSPSNCPWDLQPSCLSALLMLSKKKRRYYHARLKCVQAKQWRKHQEQRTDLIPGVQAARGFWP